MGIDSIKQIVDQKKEIHEIIKLANRTRQHEVALRLQTEALAIKSVERDENDPEKIISETETMQKATVGVINRIFEPKTHELNDAAKLTQINSAKEAILEQVNKLHYLRISAYTQEAFSQDGFKNFMRLAQENKHLAIEFSDVDAPRNSEEFRKRLELSKHFKTAFGASLDYSVDQQGHAKITCDDPVLAVAAANALGMSNITITGEDKNVLAAAKEAFRRDFKSINFEANTDEARIFNRICMLKQDLQQTQGPTKNIFVEVFKVIGIQQLSGDPQQNQDLQELMRSHLLAALDGDQLAEVVNTVESKDYNVQIKKLEDDLKDITNKDSNEYKSTEANLNILVSSGKSLEKHIIPTLKQSSHKNLFKFFAKLENEELQKKAFSKLPKKMKGSAKNVNQYMLDRLDRVKMSERPALLADLKPDQQAKLQQALQDRAEDKKNAPSKNPFQKDIFNKAFLNLKNLFKKADHLLTQKVGTGPTKHFQK